MISKPGSLLVQLVGLARRAGEQILRVYRGEEPLELAAKSDQSPVTRADLLAEEVLLEGLSRLSPGVPVLSEEGVQLEHDPQWLWLVDPLDGTREFLARNGEFTVNVALLCDGLPVLGIINVPLEGAVYAGASGHRGWLDRAGDRAELPRRPLPRRDGPVVVSMSRRQGELSLASCRDALERHCPDFVTVGTGSAVKFCTLALGQADIYPRYSPTCAWDVAAGQAILESAGGAVLDCSGEQLRYRAASKWLNGSFVAVADAGRSWDFMWSG